MISSREPRHLTPHSTIIVIFTHIMQSLNINFPIFHHYLLKKPEQALCRASEYFIKSRKHYVARQSAQSNRESIMSRVRVLYQIAEALCRPSECSIKSRKHYVARQNALSNRESIMSAVRVLYQIAKAFCRASECSIRLRKHYVGRQSALSNRASIMSAVIMLAPY